METQRKRVTSSWSLGSHYFPGQVSTAWCLYIPRWKKQSKHLNFFPPFPSKKEQEMGFLRSSGFQQHTHGHEKQARPELYNLTIWVWITPGRSQALTLTLLTRACSGPASFSSGQGGRGKKKKNPIQALRPPPAWRLSPGGRPGTDRGSGASGRGRRSPSTQRAETAARVHFSHNGRIAVPARRSRLRVRDPAWCPRTPQAGGDLDPGAPGGGLAPSKGRRQRGLRRVAEAGKRGPRSPPRLAGGAALTCVRARAVAAGAAGKGRSAARRPGACRSEGRGARKVDSMPGPRPGGPGRTRRLPAPTAGQSVTPVSPRRRGWDSGNRPPGGAAARAAGGGGGGGAGPQGRRPAHPEVLVVAAARAARRAWPPAADCVPPEEKRPGTPRRVEARAASWGGSSRPAGPTPPLRPQDGGRECELMRVPVGGYPCLGHLKLSGLEGLGEWAGAAVLTVGT